MHLDKHAELQLGSEIKWVTTPSTQTYQGHPLHVLGPFCIICIFIFYLFIPKTTKIGFSIIITIDFLITTVYKNVFLFIYKSILYTRNYIQHVIKLTKVLARIYYPYLDHIIKINYTLTILLTLQEQTGFNKFTTSLL